MTAYPRGSAYQHDAAYTRRVVKLTAADLQDNDPDVLTQVKIQVDLLDQLEVSNNAAWVTAVAELPVRWRKLFEAGDYNRQRARYLAYGIERSVLSELLVALTNVNE